MANVIVNDQNLKNIASAIREKNGMSTRYTPSEMAEAIRDIQAGGGGKRIETGTTTSNEIITGLNSIDIFIMITHSFSKNGLCHFVYYGKPEAEIAVMYSYSYNVLPSEKFSISGGIFTYTGSQYESLMQGTTYTWIAVGE